MSDGCRDVRRKTKEKPNPSYKDEFFRTTAQFVRSCYVAVVIHIVLWSVLMQV